MAEPRPCGDPSCERPSCLPPEYAPLCARHEIQAIDRAVADAEARFRERIAVLELRRTFLTSESSKLG